jgi:hypothetical protein
LRSTLMLSFNLCLGTVPRLCMHVSPVRTTGPVHPTITATEWLRRRETGSGRVPKLLYSSLNCS